MIIVEMKTVEIINNIAKIDSEVLPRMLLRFYEATFSFYCDIEDCSEAEWENILNELGMKDSDFFIKRLLEHLGFPKNDEIADGYITDYIDSTEPNRMDLLKKELIEWAIESEGNEGEFD